MIADKYRPDVDGLRAVAVVLVMLFHADLGFQGGFVGVDVFFVISGFLITGLILRSQEAGDFRLADFWVRRICRIVPAATAMLLVVVIAGTWLVFPDDAVDLAKSAAAHQVMAANVYFWRNTSYFGGASDLQPLLHTWSLAVEEQFYLGYPLLLMLLGRYGRRATAYGLSALAACSLLISMYGVRHHPAAAFYLLPPRAWELLLGGLIVFLPSPTRFPRVVLHGSSAASLVSVILTGWFYSAETPFPGLAAAVPCVAAAALVYANLARTGLVCRLLSTRPVVGVGVISYSLYLWHWPILAWYRYHFGKELSFVEGVALLAITVVIAYLSWRFIETPFRRLPGRLAARPVFVGATWSVIGCLAICGCVIVAEGFAARVPSSALRYKALSHDTKWVRRVALADAESMELIKFGALDGVATCLLWGDSHAMALAPGLQQACEELGVRGLQATYPSTPPLLDFVGGHRHGLRDNAPQFNAAVMRCISRREIDVVFLAARWDAYMATPGFELALRTTLEQLAKLDVQVCFMLDVANQEVDVPRLYAISEFWGKRPEFPGKRIERHREDNRRLEEIVREMAASNSRLTILDPAVVFVDEGGAWRTDFEGELMYRDEHHLSEQGGLRLAGLFTSALREALDATAVVGAKAPQGQ